MRKSRTDENIVVWMAWKRETDNGWIYKCDRNNSGGYVHLGLGWEFVHLFPSEKTPSHGWGCQASPKTSGRELQLKMSVPVVLSFVEAMSIIELIMLTVWQILGPKEASISFSYAVDGGRDSMRYGDCAYRSAFYVVNWNQGNRLCHMPSLAWTSPLLGTNVRVRLQLDTHRFREVPGDLPAAQTRAFWQNKTNARHGLALHLLLHHRTMRLLLSGEKHLFSFVNITNNILMNLG